MLYVACTGFIVDIDADIDCFNDETLSRKYSSSNAPNVKHRGASGQRGRKGRKNATDRIRDIALCSGVRLFMCVDGCQTFPFCYYCRNAAPATCIKYIHRNMFTKVLASLGTIEEPRGNSKSPPRVHHSSLKDMPKEQQQCHAESAHHNLPHVRLGSSRRESRGEAASGPPRDPCVDPSECPLAGVRHHVRVVRRAHARPVRKRLWRSSSSAGEKKPGKNGKQW